MTFLKTFISGLTIAQLCLGASAADSAEKAPFSREWVPQPVFDKEPGYVDLYWTAWEQAYDHVAIQDGIPQSPYMDEAFAESHIWIWDTCFMVLFCKYSPEQFPGVETLNNFYEAFHSDKYKDGSFPLGIQHPDNPPLFAWAEYGNYLFTGDDDHARTLLNDTQYLQKHFDWFDNLERGWRFKHKGGQSAEVVKDTTELGYKWAGCPSGMDNSPRRPNALWIDAIAQQGLSALAIYRMAERVGEPEMAAEWKAKYEAIKQTVNTYYWDDEDGIYYDISEDGGTFYKVKTPASYWPMLAEMCSPEQAKRMVKHITDPETFGGMRPWVTVARDAPSFDNTDGDYWRGGIWLPTAYMGTKALEKYGFQKEADDAAENLLAHMYRTYKAVEPNTIWECYSPSRDYPVVRKNGHIVREDFCGWSALGPISMFIENVLGYHTVDAKNKRVEWRLHQKKRHGLKNFKFGDTVADIIYDGKDTVSVSSNAPFKLVINGKAHSIKSGNNVLSVRAPEKATVSLNVNDGSGSGSYQQGSVVTLKAAPSKGGKLFCRWSSTAGEMDKPNSQESLFLMPGEAVTVSAVYKKACAVKFVLPDTVKRVGGGDLVQSIVEGKAAEAPEVQAEYGWAFGGWDQDFDQITGDVIVKAVVKRGVSLIQNGDFSSGIRQPATWNEFEVQSAELNRWYIPLFGDRFSLRKVGDRAPYVASAMMNADKGTAMYQTVSAPAAGRYTFSFDFMNRDGGKTEANQFSWVIWGYSEDSKNDKPAYGGSFNVVSDMKHSGTILASAEFSPGDAKWTSSQSKSFAIPAGFKRLVIGIGVNHVYSSKGDSIGIDNVSLKQASGN